VQVFAAPIEGSPKDFMEFGETGFADHEQASPHQRTHAAEKEGETALGSTGRRSSLPKRSDPLTDVSPESPSSRSPRIVEGDFFERR